MVNAKLKNQRLFSQGGKSESELTIAYSERRVVGTALTRLCPTLHSPLAAPRGLQRLGCVDIEKRAKALDRDFRHRFAMLGN